MVDSSVGVNNNSFYLKTCMLECLRGPYRDPCFILLSHLSVKTMLIVKTFILEY